MTTPTRRIRILASAALVIVGAGCHSATTEGDQIAALPCDGNVDIQVSFDQTGKIPLFDWASGCGVAILAVETVPPMGAAPVLMWGIYTSETRPFKPTITYGIVPKGATSPSPPRTLVQGVTYKVSVIQTLGLDVSVARGGRTFALP